MERNEEEKQKEQIKVIVWWIYRKKQQLSLLQKEYNVLQSQKSKNEQCIKEFNLRLQIREIRKNRAKQEICESSHEDVFKNWVKEQSLNLSQTQASIGTKIFEIQQEMKKLRALLRKDEITFFYQESQSNFKRLVSIR